MQEGAFLMSDIGAKVLAANNKPAVSQFGIQLLLDDACHFAILLRFEDALDVCDLFDG